MADKPTLAQQIEYMSNRVALLKKGEVLGFSHNVDLYMSEAILETLENMRDVRPLFIYVIDSGGLVVGRVELKDPDTLEWKDHPT